MIVSSLCLVGVGWFGAKLQRVEMVEMVNLVQRRSGGTQIGQPGALSKLGTFLHRLKGALSEWQTWSSLI